MKTTSFYFIILAVLVLFSFQLVAQVSDYEVCDDDYDGFASFDLTTKDAEIINGQTGYTVSYFETQTDAALATNPILSPINYINISSYVQTIYGQPEYTSSATYEVFDLDLIVNPIPSVIVPYTLQACDDDYDEIVGFFLESIVP